MEPQLLQTLEIELPSGYVFTSDDVSDLAQVIHHPPKFSWALNKGRGHTFDT